MTTRSRAVRQAPKVVLTLRFALKAEGLAPESSGIEVSFAADEPQAVVLGTLNQALVQFKTEAAKAVAAILVEDR